MNKLKKGLVLEGGAMRGMFTAGVIDVMMETEKRKESHPHTRVAAKIH